MALTYGLQVARDNLSREYAPRKKNKTKQINKILTTQGIKRQIRAPANPCWGVALFLILHVQNSAFPYVFACKGVVQLL